MIVQCLVKSEDWWKTLHGMHMLARVSCAHGILRKHSLLTDSGMPTSLSAHDASRSSIQHLDQIFQAGTDPDLVVQAGFQVFAWAEHQIEERKVHREAYGSEQISLRYEPMFCMETAVKLMYFSALAYDIAIDKVCLSLSSSSQEICNLPDQG